MRVVDGYWNLDDACLACIETFPIERKERKIRDDVVGRERRVIAVTGQLGWARSRDLSLLATPKLDVFTSDLGIEARPVQWNVGHALSVTPFAGLGAGVRSYNYRSLDVDATHNVAGYAAVGGELGAGRVGLRIEARDYATGFKPLVGAGSSATRNDVVLTAALKLDLHRASRR